MADSGHDRVVQFGRVPGIPTPASLPSALPSTPSTLASAGPPELTRRRLLTTATALSGIAAGTAVLPASLSRALAATLENPPRGSLRAT